MGLEPDGDGLPPLPPGGVRQQLSEDDWYRQNQDDIDPMKYAGEGWFSTDEYARAADIDDPFVRGDVGDEGSYYPGPARRRYTGKTPR